MKTLALLCVLALAASCGGDGGSCDLPTNWSSARSGDLCQVNYFTTPEHAVYCGGTAGNWDCACGPAVDNPMHFNSTDFCDLSPEERACVAKEQCGFTF